MASREHIVHSIPPTYDERSRVLVLGTMPSPRSREEGFNYGHPQNRFWRVMAALAHEPVPSTNERKRDFCLRHHIALWDVLAECDIEGASDASITSAVPNDLTIITRAAPIEAVFCTGARAYELYTRLCEEQVGIPAVKLPSTSPANAACGMPRLLREYAAIMEHEQRFKPPVLEVADVVALEQTIAAAGTSLAELMDRAGTALAKRVHEVLQEVQGGVYPQVASGQAGEEPEDEPRRVVPAREAATPLVALLCGNGNNGGDGWVAAKLLAREGVPVAVVTAKLPEELTAQPAHDAAVQALAELEECGATVVRSSDGLPLDEKGALAHVPLVLLDDAADGDTQAVRQLLERAYVVVDAILGTGASGRTPRQPFLGWVTAANRSIRHHAVVAADIPTGVSANSGIAAVPRLRADETVTMIVPKPGLSAAECGRVTVAPLAYIEPLLEGVRAAVPDFPND